MLSEEELTYTQMLTKLDLDTGHLNYYLESLGELLAKTGDGKYRLSEFGKASLGLMSGVEETKTDRRETEGLQSSRRRITRWGKLISVIALLLAGILLLNVSYVSTYRLGASGSLDRRDALIIQPSATIRSTDSINVRHFPSDTLTTHYQTFFQIDVAYTNVTLHIQLIENIDFEGPPGPNVQELPLLIYNETWSGPWYSENGTALSYTIKVPLVSPREQGYLLGNGFALYETTITNLGKETLVRNSSGNGEIVTLPNYTGSLSLQTSYPVVEETNYPYFYYGVAFLTLA